MLSCSASFIASPNSVYFRQRVGQMARPSNYRSRKLMRQSAGPITWSEQGEAPRNGFRSSSRKLTSYRPIDMTQLEKFLTCSNHS